MDRIAVNEKNFILPPWYLVTGADPRQPKEFLATLTACLEQGIRLVQLRAKTLSLAAYQALAQSAIKLCHQYNAKLLLNCDVNTAETLAADGIHLSSDKLIKEFKSLPTHKIISCACHNIDELQRAKQLGADLVTLSPVLATTTHPHATPLGWEKFQALCAQVDVPIYALGGMTPDHLPQVKACGGYGIAAISSLWPAPKLANHPEDN